MLVMQHAHRVMPAVQNQLLVLVQLATAVVRHSDQAAKDEQVQDEQVDKREEAHALVAKHELPKLVHGAVDDAHALLLPLALLALCSMEEEEAQHTSLCILCRPCA